MTRVLVVDDEVDIRMVVHAALDGCDVLGAPDGPTALEVLGGGGVDLVLLDLMMPEMDGFAVLQAIRSRPELDDVAVVMLTAKGGESDHVTAYREGADGYLTKPFDIDVLERCVEEVAALTPAERLAIRDVELGKAQLLAQLEAGFPF